MPALICVALSLSATAIDDTRLTVQGANAILRWGSFPGERFVVQRRPDLQPGTTWVTLSSGHPAAAQGNLTVYTHVGGVQAPVPCGGGTGGPAGGPPRPAGATTRSSLLQVPGIEGPVDATMEPSAFRIKTGLSAGRGVTERRKAPPPLPPLPRIPTEEERLALRARRSPEAGAQAATAATPCGVSHGFYRVLLIPDFTDNYAAPFQFTEGNEFMPIYFDMDPDEIARAQLLVNGQPFPYADLIYDEISEQFGIRFNHDRLPNGSYTLQLRTTVHTGTLRATGLRDTLVLNGRTTAVTINNPISFHPWPELIVGGSVTFRARTTTIPANWTIEIYDANPDNPDPIIVRSGVTTDGNITWTWNLRDSAGNLRTDLESDPFFDPYVTVSPGGVSVASSTTRPAPLTALDYPDHGQWLFAYQDSDKSSNPQTQAVIRQAATTSLPGLLQNVGRAVAVLPFGKDPDNDGVVDAPEQAQAFRNAAWQGLFNYLFDVSGRWRNFYYLGHGTEYWIGGDYEFDPNDPNSSMIDPNTYFINGPFRSRAYLTSEAVRNGLTYNNAFGPRPYRFAFLDGCATAAGDFPEAFGIPKQQLDLAYYNSANNIRGTRPSTFVGWNEPIYYNKVLNQQGFAGTDVWGDYQQYAFFRTQWMFNWSANPQRPRLQEALNEGQRTTTWIQLQTYNRIIRIYGYKDLRIDEYNRRTNWPPN